MLHIIEHQLSIAKKLKGYGLKAHDIDIIIGHFNTAIRLAMALPKNSSDTSIIQVVAELNKGQRQHHSKAT